MVVKGADVARNAPPVVERKKIKLRISGIGLPLSIVIVWYDPTF